MLCFNCRVVCLASALVGGVCLLSLLALIVSFCELCYSFILLVFSIAKYIPYWIVNFTSIIAIIDDFMPVGLAVVAAVCSGTMLVRFIYNAVRGSGA